MSSQSNNYRPLDAQLIKDVENVLSKFNMSQTLAIEIYYNEIARTGKIPFEILNAQTQKVIDDTDNNIDVHYANNVDELFMDLDNED